MSEQKGERGSQREREGERERMRETEIDGIEGGREEDQEVRETRHRKGEM